MISPSPVQSPVRFSKSSFRCSANGRLISFEMRAFCSDSSIGNGYGFLI
jgi:hypothetical protein